MRRWNFKDNFRGRGPTNPEQSNIRKTYLQRNVYVDQCVRAKHLFRKASFLLTQEALTFLLFASIYTQYRH